MSLFMRIFFVCILFLYSNLGYSDDCKAPNDTYHLIRNIDDLVAISEHSTGFYWLCNDIDLAGVRWKPIPFFSGYLNGNFHKIKNMNVIRSRLDWNNSHNFNLGLFGSIEAGTVENLVLENVNVEGVAYVGGLAGVASGYMSRVKNVKVTGKIKGVSVSGLVVGGASTMIAENISVGGSVEGVEMIGGFFGYVHASDLIGLGSVAFRTPEFSNLEASEQTISRKHIQIRADRMGGGIVGYHEAGWSVPLPNGSDPDNIIRDCKLSVDIRYKANSFNLDLSDSGTQLAGGIGRVYNYLVEEAEDNFDNPARVENCHIDVYASGRSLVAGLVGQYIGYAYENGNVLNNSVTGKIEIKNFEDDSRSNYIAGLIASAHYVNVELNTVRAHVDTNSHNNPSNYAGGIVGVPFLGVRLLSNKMSGFVGGYEGSTGGLATGQTDSYWAMNLVTGHSMGDAFVAGGQDLPLSNYYLEESIGTAPNLLPNQSTDESARVAVRFASEYPSSLSFFDGLSMEEDWKQMDGQLPVLRSERPACISDVNDDRVIDNLDFRMAIELFVHQTPMTRYSYGDHDGTGYIEPQDIVDIYWEVTNQIQCPTRDFGYRSESE